MPRASPIQFNLNAGEWSPLLSARIDQERYSNSLSLCRNFLPLVQGGATRRPGTRFIREARTQLDTRSEEQCDATRLLPFQFNIEQSYILEFGVLRGRVFTQDGVLLDSADEPVEFGTPYFNADTLRSLTYAQSADVLFVASDTQQVRRILRKGPEDWDSELYRPDDGPYREVNIDEDNTVVWNQVQERLEFAVEVPVDALPTFGLPVRIRVPDDAMDPDDTAQPHPNQGEWLWGFATSFNTAEKRLNIDVSLNGTLGAAKDVPATAEWRLGLWDRRQDDGLSLPRVATFYQSRLWLGGAPRDPQRLDASVIGEFNNFSPTDPDGSVNPDNAISVTLQSDEVNAIRWLVSEERGLTIGTQGREWILRPASQQQGLGPENVDLTASTRYGSAAVRPVRVGEVTLFIQRDTRTLRELVFVFENNGFRAPDLTVLSEHLMRAGIREITYQQSPQKVLWAVTDAGDLLSFTYERDQDVIGWAKHDLGGNGARVQSVATIPATDEKTDEVWLVVSRVIGGTRKWHIEKMTPMRLGGEPIEDAWYLDSALDYEGPPTDTLSGLEHLEGETVSVLADGAVHPDRVVSGGSINLEYEASRAIVGLPYRSQLQTQPIEAGAADGVAQGKIKRLHRVIFRLFESVGMLTGPEEGKTDRITFRTTSDDIEAAVPPFTGDKFVDWEGDYETPGRVYVEQDQPLPLTVLAVMPQLLTQDGG